MAIHIVVQSQTTYLLLSVSGFIISKVHHEIHPGEL